MDFVTTDQAPAAIGPYSQATIVGDLVFTAGQVALDPASGTVIEGGIEAQTARVLENLAAVLAAAGSSLSQVVKTTVFLTDMADFPAMNQVYAQAFGDHKPARATVAVAGLPLGVRVEIEAVATR
ncbi:MAG: RidA family protein [Gemmatimonadetes bacterium]|nr:RidA family protein [Gemmatimonadota bacterium]